MRSINLASFLLLCLTVPSIGENFFSKFEDKLLNLLPHRMAKHLQKNSIGNENHPSKSNKLTGHEGNGLERKPKRQISKLSKSDEEEEIKNRRLMNQFTPIDDEKPKNEETYSAQVLDDGEVEIITDDEPYQRRLMMRLKDDNQNETEGKKIHGPRPMPPRDDRGKSGQVPPNASRWNQHSSTNIHDPHKQSESAPVISDRGVRRVDNDLMYYRHNPKQDEENEKILDENSGTENPPIHRQRRFAPTAESDNNLNRRNIKGAQATNRFQSKANPIQLKDVKESPDPKNSMKIDTDIFKPLGYERRDSDSKPPRTESNGKFDSDNRFFKSDEANDKSNMDADNQLDDGIQYRHKQNRNRGKEKEKQSSEADTITEEKVLHLIDEKLKAFGPKHEANAIEAAIEPSPSLKKDAFATPDDIDTEEIEFEELSDDSEATDEPPEKSENEESAEKRTEAKDPIGLLDYCFDINTSDYTYNQMCKDVEHIQLAPSEWEAKYPRCGGQYQSPINIPKSKLKSSCRLGPVKSIMKEDDGNCQYKDLVYDTSVKGWNVVFETEKCDSPPTVLVNTEKYYLFKMDFRLKSEHSINGKYGDAEIQMVFKNPNDTAQTVNFAILLKVYDVLEEYTKIDNYLGRLEDYARRQDGGKGRFDRKLDPSTTISEPLSFVPDSNSYYTYYGSETSPPCTENVWWVVFPEYMYISKLDLNGFKESMMRQKGSIISSDGSFARPVQELNSRTIDSCRYNF